MKKVVLITGASGGIGRELCFVYAKYGYDLIISGTSYEKLVNLKNEILNKFDLNIDIFEGDLSNYNTNLMLYNKYKDKNINVLINNAGFGDYGYFIDGDISKYRKMIDLNITSLTTLSNLFGKDMCDNLSGHIINVGSIASFQPGPLMSVYYASKSYVLSFSEAINKEFNFYNVYVMILCPPPTESSFFDYAGFNKNSKAFLGKMKYAKATDLANYTYKMMLKKKRVALYGFSNRFIVFIQRFLPSKLVINLVYSIQKGRSKDE